MDHQLKPSNYPLPVPVRDNEIIKHNNSKIIEANIIDEVAEKSNSNNKLR